MWTLRRRGHLVPQTSTRQRPSQPIAGRPSLIHHRARTRQAVDPLEHLPIRRRKPRPEQLTGPAVDRRRSDRPRMHIQPDTRTLSKHRGLLTHVGKAKHGNALGNPRDCVSEVPASNHYRRAVTSYGLESTYGRVLWVAAAAFELTNRAVERFRDACVPPRRRESCAASA
jgi:hypothetical protein